MSILQDAMQKAIQTAIGLAPASWLPGGTPDPLIGKRGKIGAPVSRIDGPLKVAGQARFAAEVPMENMLYASFVHSTIAKGEILSIDTKEAEATPGVTLVMTHENSPRMKGPGVFGVDADGAAASYLPVMQDGKVHWNGQTVAVILAESQEQGDHVARLVTVRYKAEAGCTAFEAAKKHAHQPDTVLGEPAEIKRGDADQALTAAAISVDNIYRTPRYNHNAIELHAATLKWDGDELIVHDASQLVTQTKLTLGKVFNVDAEGIRVLSPYVGGGFGGKCLWDHQILAAAAAKLVDRPVRVTLSRESVYRLVGGRTQTEQRVALAANSDGGLAALIHTGVAAMTTHNNCPEQFTFPTRHLYGADTVHIAQEIAEMDMLANSWMRAPGESVGTFALESALDELAEKLAIDPIELRRRIEPEKDPTTGHAFSSRHLLQAYERGAAQFGWERRNPVPQCVRDGEWLIGMGCATGTYPITACLAAR